MTAEPNVIPLTEAESTALTNAIASVLPVLDKALQPHGIRASEIVVPEWSRADREHPQ